MRFCSSCSTFFTDGTHHACIFNLFCIVVQPDLVHFRIQPARWPTECIALCSHWALMPWAPSLPDCNHVNVPTPALNLLPPTVQGGSTQGG